MFIPLTLKLVLILMFAFIGFQDIKERQVYWFLIVSVCVLCGLLFYQNSLSELFLNAVIMNVVFVSTLILIIYMYSRLKLKSKFSEAIGLGDILLFFGLTLSFSTVSFIVVFISSFFFSLVLHLLVKRKSTFNTIPLAGYMSLFFSITYISYWFGFIDGLYTL
tara:strand:- start:1567 stop:2055 length:489 start_codon:yes stop_codon:yes gene_type:complete